MISQTEIEFQLRSEETGLTFCQTFSEAFDKIQADSTIWKISANRKRCIIIRSEKNLKENYQFTIFPDEWNENINKKILDLYKNNTTGNLEYPLAVHECMYSNIHSTYYNSDEGSEHDVFVYRRYYHKNEICDDLLTFLERHNQYLTREQSDIIKGHIEGKNDISNMMAYFIATIDDIKNVCKLADFEKVYC